MGFISPGARRHLPGDPEFPLDINKPRRQSPVTTIFECNPNKLPNGIDDLRRLVSWIFGHDCPDLKFSRQDFNGETTASVTYLWNSVRIPFKRRSDDIGELIRLYKSKGAETFYLGRPPNRVRIYNKRQEMSIRGEDVSYLPDVFTRVEVELRHDHCPVRSFADLEKLQDYRPFQSLQILDSIPYYDYQDKNQIRSSMRRRLYNALVEDWGAHDARRIANFDRHFARNFREVVVDNEKLKSQLEASHAWSLKQFFDGKCADVEALYRPKSEYSQGAAV
jgi:hypothetical protein